MDTDTRRTRKINMAKQKKRKKKKSVKKKKSFSTFRILRKITYWIFVLAIWGGIAVVGLFGFYGLQLPSVDTWDIPQRQTNITIVDDTGRVIAQRGAGGKAVSLAQMSPYIPQAVIAVEDRRFHRHFGFDPIGFARAMMTNMATLSFRQGGSTITQQLAKNMFLKPERTIKRKIQELILAFWLEANYSKAEILELYLNRVYLGSGAWGIDAAARLYYGKTPLELNLYESALLAGLLKAPSNYTPLRDAKRAEQRAQIVLEAMKQEGYITNDGGRGDKATITPQSYRQGAEHYAIDMVMRRVVELFGEVRGDIIIETTLSTYAMNAAQKAVENHLGNTPKRQVALVTLTPDGAIRALIGGKDYGDSTFNRAVFAQRQPGSVFKTFLWLAALEKGLNANNTMIDEAININGWKPKNFNKEFKGEVTLQQAFAESLNTIAVKLIAYVGVGEVIKMAKRMGIESELENNRSLALGTSEVSLMELSRAYTILANGGANIEPYLIKQIKDSSGKIIFERNPIDHEQVLETEIVGAMNGMLYNAVEYGTGKNAKLQGHIVAGKTGTTQNWRDAWFVGYTSHLVSGVWIGNDDNTTMNQTTSGASAARLWHDYMEDTHQGLNTDILPGTGFISFILN